mgnify:CR=1 FL=1
MVGSNKAVTVNKKISLPPITEKDIAAIQIAREMGVSNFAFSFANSKSNVIKFRELSGPKSRVISKIESIEGLMNLNGIAKESDEILIDRGDLSKEVKIERRSGVAGSRRKGC